MTDDPQAATVNGWVKTKLIEIVGIVGNNKESLKGVKVAVDKLDERQRDIKTSVDRADQKLSDHVSNHPPCSQKMRELGLTTEQMKAATAKPNSGAITWKDFFLKVAFPLGLLMGGALLGEIF